MDEIGMKDINEWFADKCGVELRKGKYGVKFYKGSQWSIKRADCREIIRERFKLDTLVGIRSKNLKTWICEYLSDTDGHLIQGGRGKTIAEAEIACLTAIYKQESA